jgi:hypothetical protein
VFAVDPVIVVTVTLVVKTFVVVSAFDAYTFPDTNTVVSPGSPVSVTVSRLDVDETFNVVELMNGIVSVSKLKTVLAALDVIPAVYRFVVVTAFET